MTIKSLSQADSALVSQIVRRANPPGRAGAAHLTNDLAACHDSVGLKLQELLDADDATFTQEIADIQKYVNRETGEMLEHTLLFKR